MSLRERFEYIDLIPIKAKDYLGDDCLYAEIEAAFVFRDYASLKTLFGAWIQVGDN